MLNASDWGGHHHHDSLDLYYWQDGRELLSDLGYLWDHPDKSKTSRTLAHNLVLIDGQNQRSKGRRGSFHLFSLTSRIKVMEASSRAYPRASIYRRTCIQVDHGEAGSYLVDIFRAGGATARDYVFHGPGNEYAVDGLDLAPSS
ncbi:MAG: heparinase II/III family protein, partial [Phycisphaerae bacterium]